jgi:hypothetical protein
VPLAANVISLPERFCACDEKRKADARHHHHNERRNQGFVGGTIAPQMRVPDLLGAVGSPPNFTEARQTPGLSEVLSLSLVET